MFSEAYTALCNMILTFIAQEIEPINFWYKLLTLAFVGLVALHEKHIKSLIRRLTGYFYKR